MLRRRRALALAAMVLVAYGCSVQQMAVDRLGDALAAGGSTFAADEDPQLVRDALPFTLKLIESLLAESPRHEGLLLAAASGFTQYAYAFVQQDADRAASESFEQALAGQRRARKLYLRARDYGLRLLDARHPGTRARLSENPEAALAAMTRDDVPALYWTAASWGAAISLGKDDPSLVADLPAVQALVDRAIALDESWNDGSLHSFLISYEPARPGAGPRGYQIATEHYERAVALSRGKLASPHVSWAESVAIPKQDLAAFDTAIGKALAIDPKEVPEWQLENLIAQERARWLQGRTEELFLIEDDEEGEAETEDAAPPALISVRNMDFVQPWRARAR